MAVSAVEMFQNRLSYSKFEITGAISLGLVGVVQEGGEGVKFSKPSSAYFFYYHITTLGKSATTDLRGLRKGERHFWAPLNADDHGLSVLF